MLPPSILQSAFVSASGELAWRRAQLPEVVRTIADAGLLILGGEAWVVRDERVFGVLPARDGSEAVLHWETQVPRDVTWEQLVQHAAAETMSVLAGLDAEEQVKPEYAAHIWYNLTFCTREGWKALQ